MDKPRKSVFKPFVLDYNKCENYIFQLRERLQYNTFIIGDWDNLGLDIVKMIANTDPDEIYYVHPIEP